MPSTTPRPRTTMASIAVRGYWSKWPTATGSWSSGLASDAGEPRRSPAILISTRHEPEHSMSDLPRSIQPWCHMLAEAARAGA